MSHYILLAIISIAFFSLKAEGYTDCGSKVGVLESLKVSGCNLEEKCILKRQTNVTIEIDFKSLTNSNTVTAKVWGILLDVPVSFKLPNDNGCTSGIACPITSGTSYNYQTILPVLKSYPRVSVVVKWELIDDKNENIICVLIPSKLN